MTDGKTVPEAAETPPICIVIESFFDGLWSLVL